MPSADRITSSPSWESTPARHPGTSGACPRCQPRPPARVRALVDSGAIALIRSRSILAEARGYIGHTPGRQDGYDFTLSPYSACAFNCSYCYAPTIYGLRQFAETWTVPRAKINAADLLRIEARHERYAGKAVYLSPVTDAYQPVERDLRLTRQLLAVLCEAPPRYLNIQTRSPMVACDVDLLQRLGDRVTVSLSIPTDDDGVRRQLEPTAPPIERRLEALAALSAAGVRTRVSIAPALPMCPERLVALVAPHASWITVQALKIGGGARTRKMGRELIHTLGYDDWLEGGPAVNAAMAALKSLLGDRYYGGRAGFLPPG